MKISIESEVNNLADRINSECLPCPCGCVCNESFLNNRFSLCCPDCGLKIQQDYDYDYNDHMLFKSSNDPKDSDKCDSYDEIVDETIELWNNHMKLFNKQSPDCGEVV